MLAQQVNNSRSSRHALPLPIRIPWCCQPLDSSRCHVDEINDFMQQNLKVGEKDAKPDCVDVTLSCFDL